MRTPIPLMIIALIISAGPIMSLYYFGGKSFVNEMKSYGKEYEKAVDDCNKEKVESDCSYLKEKLESVLENYRSNLKYSLEMAYKIKSGEIAPQKVYEVYWAYPNFVENINITAVRGILNGSYTNDEYLALENSLDEAGKKALQNFLEDLNSTDILLNHSSLYTNESIYWKLDTILNQAGLLLHNFLISIMNVSTKNILNESLTKYSMLSVDNNETIFLRWLGITISPQPLNPLMNSIADLWVMYASQNGYWYEENDTIYISMKYDGFVAKSSVNPDDFRKIINAENYNYVFVVSGYTVLWSNDVVMEGKNVSEDIKQYVSRYDYTGAVNYENKDYYMSVKTLSNYWKVVVMEEKNGDLRIENVNMLMEVSVENYRRSFFFVLGGSIVFSELTAFLYFYYDTTLKFKIYSKLRGFRKRKISK